MTASRVLTEKAEKGQEQRLGERQRDRGGPFSEAWEEEVPLPEPPENDRSHS